LFILELPFSEVWQNIRINQIFGASNKSLGFRFSLIYSFSQRSSNKNTCASGLTRNWNGSMPYVTLCCYLVQGVPKNRIKLMVSLSQAEIKMNHSYFVVISIVLVVVVVLGLVYLYNNLNRPVSTPAVLYTSNISPAVSTQITGGVLNVIVAARGETQQINLTLTSQHSSQIAVKIENLRLIAYNSTIDNKNWDASNWNTSMVQERVFNYSFGLSELTLQPYLSNSTIITLSLTNNAPIGKYALEIDLGNGNDDLSWSGSIR
jgi:hypothetical protein